MKSLKLILSAVLAISLGAETNGQFSDDFSTPTSFVNFTPPYISTHAGCYQRIGQNRFGVYDANTQAFVASSNLYLMTPVVDFKPNWTVELDISAASYPYSDIFTFYIISPQGGFIDIPVSVNITRRDTIVITDQMFTSANRAYRGMGRPYLALLRGPVALHTLDMSNVIYSPGPNCTVVSTGGGCADADADGACDDVDDYPNDPDKAYSSMLPQMNWMYEDLYPNYGDFDFNDMVISSEREMITDADNILRVLKVKATVSAAGAAISQGWALELKGISASDVLSVNGNSLTEGVLTMNANGTENGQTNAVIPMFDNFKTISNNNGSQFLNTVKADAIGSSTPLEVVIEFSKNSDLSVRDLDYNFFSFRTNDRGHEIHEMGFTPTDLANNALFGTGKDATDLNNGASYVSVDGFPWAISSMGGDYAIEKVDMVQAFLKFAAWAQSGGVSFQDWHTNMSATYRNAANIY